MWVLSRKIIYIKKLTLKLSKPPSFILCTESLPGFADYLPRAPRQEKLAYF